MKMFKALIIDDEKLARDRLSKLLSKYNDSIDICGQVQNSEEAISHINKYQPDLLFLDIEMPKVNGFQLLELLESKPLVIFTTAYDQYALKAFNNLSIDYLLKPIDEEKLERAIKKLDILNQKRGIERDYSVLLDVLTTKKLTTLGVKSGDKIRLLPVSDIVRIQSKDKYLSAYDNKCKEYVLDKTLKQLISSLPDKFIRVHRSHIINLDKLREIRKTFGGKYVLVLNDNGLTEITCSTSYVQQLRKNLMI